MVNARIATGAEQPINRDGAVSQYAGEEGDLVGMDANGDWVMADADSGVMVPAVGVLAAPVTDPANYTHEELSVIIESERELLGENRIAAINGGIILENSDEDWGFTPGEPVFLAVGGGFTQTEPSGGSGEVRQVVGVATDDGEAVFVNINPDYTVA